MRQWYAKNAERHRETARASRNRRLEAAREYDRRARGGRVYGPREKASSAVAQALKTGRLLKGPCERSSESECRGRIEAHHSDYTRPLAVRWLCKKHHSEEHRRIGVAARQEKIVLEETREPLYAYRVETAHGSMAGRIAVGEFLLEREYRGNGRYTWTIFDFSTGDVTGTVTGNYVSRVFRGDDKKLDADSIERLKVAQF